MLYQFGVGLALRVLTSAVGTSPGGKPATLGFVLDLLSSKPGSARFDR